MARLDATGGASAAPTKRKICQCKNCTIDIKTDKLKSGTEKEKERSGANG